MACETQREARDAAARELGKAQRYHTYATRRIRELARGLRRPTPEQRAWARGMQHTWLEPAEVVSHRPTGWPQPYWTIASWAEHRAEVAVALPGLRAKAIAAQRALRECLGAIPPVVEPVPVPTNDQEADALIAGLGGRCGLARVGHGHVGEACRVRLGDDGICQHHGAAVA